MKTKFFAIAAVAALFAAACTQEVLDGPVMAGEEVTVNFVTEAPVIATKAVFSDGQTAKKLYYAVYAEDQKKVLIQGEADFNNLKTSVDITLVTGKVYDIIFWAQKVGAPYVFDMAAQTVTADYSSVDANNEDLDAFCFTVDSYKVVGPKAEPVTLRRPFAQINVGTNDTAKAAKAGYTAAETDMVVANVPNLLNLKDGSVSGEAEVSFAKAAIPTGQTFPVTAAAGEPAYDYLAMNYILAAADKTTTQVDFVIYSQNENDIEFTISNVPVQRNYRTNIYGELLTNPTVWNITIDPAYNTPSNDVEIWNGVDTEDVTPNQEGVYEVSNAAQLAGVAAKINAREIKTGTIRLTDNISLAGQVWNPINLWGVDGKALVIDGNGYAISDLKSEAVTVSGVKAAGFISHNSGTGTLEIKNLKFDNAGFKGGSFIGTVIGYQYGDVTMTNVDVDGTVIEANGIRNGGLVGFCVANDGASLSLTDCDVANSSISGIHNLSGLVGSVLAADKATFTNCTSKNNTFYHTKDSVEAWQDFDANGLAEGLATKVDCKAEGNKGYLADGVSVLSETEYEISNAAGMNWFAAQVNEKGNTFAGKTVALANDIDLENKAWTPVGTNADDAKKFQGTFDGQNKTISNFTVKQDAGYHAAGLFGALNGTVQNLVIDNANIESVSESSANGTSNGTAIVAGSIYTSGLIKDVTVKNSSVKGNRYVGGIAGYVYGKIEGCSVENTTVTAECDELTGNWDNGDKVGGIAGYFPADSDNYIRNCSVKDVTIEGYRDLGGIAGFATDEVSECEILGNVVINVDCTHNYKNYKNQSEYDAGHIVGDGTADTTNSGTATINFTIKTVTWNTTPELDADGNVKAMTHAEAIANAPEGFKVPTKAEAELMIKYGVKTQTETGWTIAFNGQTITLPYNLKDDYNGDHVYYWVSDIESYTNYGCAIVSDLSVDGLEVVCMPWFDDAQGVIYVKE